MTKPNKKREPVLLVVDDEPINLIIITETLAGLGFELIATSSGEDAWKKLQAEPDKFDAVLLDRMMPGMNGMDVLRSIKQHPQLKLLPVILQTAASAPEQIAEGLNEGAFYYLSKPFRSEVLRAVVTTAVRDRLQRTQEKKDIESKLRALSHLDQANFVFRTPQAAKQIAELLSCLCPSSQIAHMGLVELMLNAVEHGNLDISYAEKTQLIVGDSLQAEIERRLALAEYANREATVSFKRTNTRLIFTIQDQGKGFDWQPYLEMSVERMMDNHGRGIAMARSLAFNQIEYRGCGNCVEASISITAANTAHECQSA